MFKLIHLIELKRSTDRSYCFVFKNFRKVDYDLQNQRKQNISFVGKIVLALLLVISSILPSLSVKAFVIDEQWSFSFTGASQSFTAQEGGKYKLEVFGAQGASSGGKGGKAEAIFDLYEGDQLTINVGGQNGYNGGGPGSATGGGASDIVLNGTDRLIAGAGGGGGSGGTGGGNGTGSGGTSVGTGAGSQGINGGGGGRSSNYTYETGYYEDTGYWKETGYYDRKYHQGPCVGGWNDAGICQKYDSYYENTWVSTGQEWVDTGSSFVSTGYSTTQGRAGQGGSNFFNAATQDKISTNGVQSGNGYVVITAIEPHNIKPEITLETEQGDNLFKSYQTGFNEIRIKGQASDVDEEDTFIVQYSLVGVQGYENQPLETNENGEFDYTFPIPDNLHADDYLIEVWATDSKNADSMIAKIDFYLETVQPTITFENIVEGETVIGQIVPDIKIVGGRAEIVTSILLNDQPYDGARINTSGQYELVVTATDIVGNESSETIIFTVNQSPFSLQEIGNQFMKKFGELTFDINDYFKDAENEELEIIVTNSNDDVITTEINEKSFTFKAIKQGTSDITVKVNDGHSDSDLLTFLISVETQIPVITLTSNEWILINDETDVTISGTINDPDKEKVKVTGTINEVTKSATIEETTGDEDTWILTWSNTELPYGVYSEEMDFKAEDDFSGLSETTFSKLIIKINGKKEEYMEQVNIYSDDIGQDAINWNVATHSGLFEAYDAMQVLREANTLPTQVDAETKVNALKEGLVKEQFLREIETFTFEWLLENFAVATVADYSRGGIPNVTENILINVNEYSIMYSGDKDEIIPGDILLIAVIAKMFNDAEQSHNVNDWLEGLKMAENLQYGKLQSKLIRYGDEGIFNTLNEMPSSLTVKLLTGYYNIISKEDNLLNYIDYLTDIVNYKDTIIDLRDLTIVVGSVNKAVVLYIGALENITNKTVQDFIDHIELLVNGQYKTEQRGKYESLRLLNFVTNLQDQSEKNFTDLGMVIIPENVKVYKENLTSYIQSQGAEAITIEVIQNVVDVTDALIAYKKVPTTENLKDLVDAIDKLNPSSDLVVDIQKEMEKLVLDAINKNLGSVTKDELEIIGTENVDENRIPNYGQALEEYEVTKSPLSVEDIQSVVDAVNAVEDAKENPTSDTIKNAHVLVKKLEDGSLKDRLLHEIEDLAVEYIKDNSESIIAKDLEHANIDNVDADLIGEYSQHLQDVLPGLSPVSKDDIQNVIDTVNEITRLYDNLLSNLIRENLNAYVDAIEALIDGNYKDSHIEKIPIVTLSHIRFVPNEQDVETYEQLQLPHDSNNIDSYNQYLPTYVEDNKPLEITREEIETFIGAVDAYEIAYDDSNASAVADALQEITKLNDGELKDLLLKNLTGKVLDTIKDNFVDVTTEDLVNIGIGNLIKENEEDYQNALEEYQDQLGEELTLGDIQNVIDAINALKDAENTPTPESLQDALDAIHKLKDGPLKDRLLEDLIEVALEYIEQNSDDVTIEILVLIGIEDVEPTLIEDYKEYLKGYQPLSKDKIQDVVNVTNQLQNALEDVSLQVVDSFTTLVNSLEDSTLKTNLEKVSDVLHAILAYEKAPNNDTSDSLVSALNTVTTHNKAYIDSMVISVELAVTTALEPSDAAVEHAIESIEELLEGKFKTRLLAKIGEAYLEYVQKNTDKVTAEDLIKAGFERVVEELLEEYREGLVSTAEENGILAREDIQLIIDVVNGLNDEKVIENLNKAKELKEEIENLVESDWKAEKLDEVNKLINKLTPRPPSGGGGGTIEPEPETEDKEAEEGNDLIVEGEVTDNGYEFTINPEIVDSSSSGNQSIVVKQGGNVEITLPSGSIDFAALQKELGKFGLLIQLIKLDESNYKLVVKATTPNGERELVNFGKHLTVAMKGSNILNPLEWSASIAANFDPEKTYSRNSVVLRKDGDTLSAVPHTFDGKAFTIKTTRVGHFIIMDDYKTFDDIKNYANRDEIEELALRQITSGTTPTTYSPEGNITRAQLASMIARAMDLQATKQTNFVDVKGKWYENDVQALFEAGIIAGISPTTFNPQSNVTRQQAAAMMARALRYANAEIPKVKELPYVDAERVAEYARGDISTLNQLNIMIGKENNAFDPYSKLTRAHMATLLNRTMKQIKFM